MEQGKKTLLILFVAGLSCISLIPSIFAQSGGPITRPLLGELIQNRKNFPVHWSIPSHAQNRAQHLHYWISLAGVSGTDTPNLHWPKFYIRQANGCGSIFDGGNNPSSIPQPMIILLLKVDDAANASFDTWLRTGAETRTWEGIPVDPNQIVAKVPILFP